MADSIALEIVTPDGVKLSENVSELTATSVDGEFGVLPSHRPMLAALTTGIVTYVKNGEKHSVAVGPASPRSPTTRRCCSPIASSPRIRSTR